MEITALAQQITQEISPADVRPEMESIIFRHNAIPYIVLMETDEQPGYFTIFECREGPDLPSYRTGNSLSTIRQFVNRETS